MAPDASLLIVARTMDGALPDEVERHSCLWPRVARVSDGGPIHSVFGGTSCVCPIVDDRGRWAGDF